VRRVRPERCCVTAGTIFERMSPPLPSWFTACGRFATPPSARKVLGGTVPAQALTPMERHRERLG